MTPTSVRVDDRGIHFDGGFGGAGDVEFDARRVWSFAVDEPTREPVTVSWPKVLKRRLDGRSRVRVLQGDTELFADTVQFGTGTDPVSFVDKRGNPIIIDKWGLIQRPFDARRGSGVVEAMTDKAQQMLAVMREECGIEGWIAFGTLLGAARDGSVIGHDSDIDLCYLSEQPTPALMTLELWRIGRALRRAGMRVQYKSGSFLTVLFRAPDGAAASIDLYTTFFLDGRLHETATVRAPLPRSAVLPLRDIEFEGEQLPAPADVPALLEVSYGPGWRVPDPSFKHEPGPEIVRRFDGWFGSLMLGRRDWTHRHRLELADPPRPSDFARWVEEQVDPGALIVEVGCGGGADVRHWASSGRRVLGLDYALPPGAGRTVSEEARLSDLNLLDLRDVLARGALLSRRRGARVVVARGLLESLDDDGRANFWQLVSMVLRPGGALHLEGTSMTRRRARAWSVEHEAGPVRPFAPGGLDDAVRAAGGTVTAREGFAAAQRAIRTGDPVTWRMSAVWPAPADRKATA
ncbi:bifunctional 2-polyprenyl-6-hydroxyphenol methylase/3-demethylubiquinol 3-O-methyltransferase UbiG [Nocardioides sp. SYSU D00038]|uniref:class I SAM-dependent methyltransferase n=1 Tax=Nocardioides sp. SYSU D00038 TaxID=2812554 RepID=UPI0019685B4E|nr:class I SAM-dependent methyltransferase [Nocardioides sp. SYSU D00038]